MKVTCLILGFAGVVAAVPAHAQGISAKQSEVVKQLLATYAAKAREEAKDDKRRGPVIPFRAFSADVGREFFLKRRTWQATDYTCSGCHTENPAKEGRHHETKKAIKPLAPAVSPERFTDAAKVEKNFTEHCQDLHERDCLAMEKGDFITYLLSVK